MVRFAILGAMVELELVAHRGYPERFPENSFPGMTAALEAGCRYVEFDVQFTRDGVPVVLHDASLRRIARRAGKIYRIDHAVLAGIPAGEPNRFSDEYQHLRIPTLAEMLELVASYPGVTAFVEVKRASLWKLGRGRAMEALHPLLQLHADRSVLLSFDRELVQLGRKAGHQVGWAFEPWRQHRLAQARKLAPDYLFTSMRGLPPGREAFWPGPWRWAVYEVEDFAEARWLASLGAHFVETDWIVEWLAENQAVDSR